ncbi:GNAT family N-acetyltransferase [Paenibacillus sp. KS-LC4]|uniref:GNAT family N-acetyltransferase n=1 Tax=Paenibacillus sp. KS-LC4 TaxID=2979727 RepID=UPI0030CDFA85
MFKRVENELELAMFNGVWTTVWREKGFDLEFSAHALERLMVVTEEGHYVGTAELKPYSAASTINETGFFQEHPELILAQGETAEIDKIALLKPYRGQQYISELLSSLIYTAEERQIKYFVSLLEPVFSRALRVTFKLPLDKLGEKVFYKGDYVVPMIFNVEQIYANKQKYAWLSYSQQTFTTQISNAGAREESAELFKL